jgi:hypothetical protein
VREDRNGQEYYVLRNDGLHDANDAPCPATVKWRETLADIDTRDRIYRTMLAGLGLSGEHTRHLRQRGLIGQVIQNAGYATLPATEGERARVVREIVQSIGGLYLLNVPGFYKRNGSKETRLAGTPGILIPVRDEFGRIQACLIRVDETRDGGGKYRWLSAPADAIGCGPGLCAHVPLHEASSAKIVRITEGLLKADIATALSGVPTIGLPGVGAWKLAVPVLERLVAKKVLVAFDADARTNPHVARPLTRIVEALEAAGYDVAIEHWPYAVGKGIDDVLAGGNQSALRIAAGDDLPRVLADIASGAGVPSVTASREGEPEEASPTGSDERKSQAKALLELAADIDCFHSPDGQLFGDVRIEERRETWPIGSAAFRQWLALRMYRTHDKPAGAHAMNDALAVLEARARFDGRERQVFLRVAEADGHVYIDLVNAAWEVVDISPTGWRVITNPPVRFRRTGGMRPLPYPIDDGTLDELRPFLNIDSDDDWRLGVAWLLGAMRVRGPYPLAVLQGEQGCAKSTTARVFRDLIDPNSSPLRAKPRDVQDLMIAAVNGWVICYDNLSGLSTDLSDGLCRLATGGGLGTRLLFTNMDEVLLEAQRPSILTGIDAIATRADLVDRSLILTLPPIAESKRQPEAAFWNAFEAARPRILGALFTVVAGALGNSGSTVLATLPRMADFANWVTSAEPALGWTPGTFMQAYVRNRGAAAVSTVEADPVSMAVQHLVETRGEWSGVASELLETLTEQVGESVARQRAWPRTAHKLSERLNRAAPALRTGGIDVERQRSKARRTVILRKAGPSVATVESPGDASTLFGDTPGYPSVTRNPRKLLPGDTGDAGDALSSSHAEELRPSPASAMPIDPSTDAARILGHPLIADAIRLLEPETIEVRLPDGRSWRGVTTSQSAAEPLGANDDRQERNNQPTHGKEISHVATGDRFNGIQRQRD